MYAAREHKMRKTFHDKIVVIAGGASGMGEQVALQLYKNAQKVIILDRNKEAGERTKAESAGVIQFEYIEMTHAGEVLHTLRQINKEYGSIDYFFNFAGSFLGGEIRDTPIEHWHKIMETNLQPIINGTVAAYELMRKNGHGHIINVASAAGLFPVPAMGIYGGSKHAVVGLTAGLRLEAKSLNIDVSLICPTIVETPLYDTALYDGLDKPKALELLKHQIKVQQPDMAAKRIITGVRKNKFIIHTSFSTRIAWLLYRISPSLYIWSSRRFLRVYRNTLRLK